MVIWLSLLAVTGVAAVLAALQIGFGPPAAVGLALYLLIAGLVAGRFLSTRGAGIAKAIEAVSGVWTLLLYLALGALPLVLRLVEGDLH